MRMFVALIVLIAFSAGAQACWVPPTNIVDNSTNEVEPVKVVEPIEVIEPVEETPEVVDETDAADASTDEKTEVIAPITGIADEVVTEEPGVVETPVVETETEIKVYKSSGYGEAHIVELTTTKNVLEQDAESHPVETEPVLLAPISASTTVKQNDESNVMAVGTDNNNGLYVSFAIALALTVLIAGAISIRK